MEFKFQKLNMKEWRSKKELENYLMETEQEGIIGWVSCKTMKKWGEEKNDEDMFVYQKGKNYFYLTFRNNFKCNYW